MGEDEKRTIRANALLEFEDAKASLALLRAKADQWYKLHELVSHLLARMRRDSAHMESAAIDAKAALLRSRADLTPVMDIEGLLALDAELETGMERMKCAMAGKKALGFE